MHEDKSYDPQKDALIRDQWRSLAQHAVFFEDEKPQDIIQDFQDAPDSAWVTLKRDQLARQALPISHQEILAAFKTLQGYSAIYSLNNRLVGENKDLDVSYGVTQRYGRIEKVYDTHGRLISTHNDSTMWLNEFSYSEDGYLTNFTARSTWSNSGYRDEIEYDRENQPLSLTRTFFDKYPTPADTPTVVNLQSGKYEETKNNTLQTPDISAGFTLESGYRTRIGAAFVFPTFAQARTGLAVVLVGMTGTLDPVEDIDRFENNVGRYRREIFDGSQKVTIYADIDQIESGEFLIRVDQTYSEETDLPGWAERQLTPYADLLQYRAITPALSCTIDAHPQLINQFLERFALRRSIDEQYRPELLHDGLREMIFRMSEAAKRVAQLRQYNKTLDNEIPEIDEFLLLRDVFNYLQTTKSRDLIITTADAYIKDRNTRRDYEFTSAQDMLSQMPDLDYLYNDKRRSAEVVMYQSLLEAAKQAAKTEDSTSLELLFQAISGCYKTFSEKYSQFGSLPQSLQDYQRTRAARVAEIYLDENPQLKASISVYRKGNIHLSSGQMKLADPVEFSVSINTINDGVITTDEELIRSMADLLQIPADLIRTNLPKYRPFVPAFSGAQFTIGHLRKMLGKDDDTSLSLN